MVRLCRSTHTYPSSLPKKSSSCAADRLLFKTIPVSTGPPVVYFHINSPDAAFSAYTLRSLQCDCYKKSEMISFYTWTLPAANVENLTVGAQNTRSSNLSARLKLPNHLRLRLTCRSEMRRRKRQRHWRQHHNERSDASRNAHCRAHHHITDLYAAFEVAYIVDGRAFAKDGAAASSIFRRYLCTPSIVCESVQLARIHRGYLYRHS